MEEDSTVFEHSKELDGIIGEKHMVPILIYLVGAEKRTKKDIYEAVSKNPRMPTKLEKLEELGLLTMFPDGDSRSTAVALTEKGRKAAEMLAEVVKIL